MRARSLQIYIAASISLALVAATLIHGPILQPAHYHGFADTRAVAGIANGADVLSNIGFLLAGWYGLLQVWRSRLAPALDQIRPAYTVFFGALVLTAFCSSWYHLAPDNARLVWDRLPIAIACAALLVAAAREYLDAPGAALPLMLAFAFASVAWWRYTDLLGHGDLGPYLALQLLPIVLIPLLQWLAKAAREQRIAFALAIGLYVLAKLCEMADHALLAALGLASGHTLKHMLAALAGLALAKGFAMRR
ncbi:MAG: alkaline phytoceramidase [Pseudomonadota bacterium]